MMCWLYFFFFFRPLSPGIPRFCRGFGAAWKLGKGQQGDPWLMGRQRKGEDTFLGFFQASLVMGI